MSEEKDHEPASAMHSHTPMPAGAVFLSYASEDAVATEHIATALRNAGIEVWFDKSELRGGDAWDQSIRKQIKACALFIPIISRHAHDRIEGYFRLEWKLAVDRSYLIAPDQAFLLPVAIDDTSRSDERIPDRFRELQWTCLPGGETTPAFVERVRRLLLHEASSVPVAPASLKSMTHASAEPTAPALSFRPALWATAAVLAVVLVYVIVDKFWTSKHMATSAPVASTAPAAAVTPEPATAFTPPPHSIAVLPFVNMSGDKDQDYFSDGLTEELLNDLARIKDLQVSGRTSSFYFKGKDTDLNTIARKLNVAAILEGSVRRSQHTVRITTQLINAVSGFHLWSETYDRDLGDVLKLQTEVANAVASALKVNLLGDAAAKTTVGGTQNPAAFDSFLRATRIYNNYQDAKDEQAAIALYTEAIRLDPHYALAMATRAIVLNNLGSEIGQNVRDLDGRAKIDAQRAIALAPELVEGHLALALVLADELDFAAANAAFSRAFGLAPDNARVLRDYAGYASGIGRVDAGIAAGRRAVALDPFNRYSHIWLSNALINAHRYEEALGALQDVLALDPKWGNATVNLGITYYLLGNFERARSSCEATDYPGSQECLAYTYNKLGRRADAEATMTRIQAARGDTEPYLYAQIYAQWGDATTALKWLESAMRNRDPLLAGLKTDPLLDPLRKQPHFQAIEQTLRFPD